MYFWYWYTYFLCLKYNILLFLAKQISSDVHVKIIMSMLFITYFLEKFYYSMNNLVISFIYSISKFKTNFIPILRSQRTNIYFSYWKNLPANFVSKLKNIFTSVLNKTWFKNSNLSRSFIAQFNCLRIGHSLLPAYAIKLC